MELAVDEAIHGREGRCVGREMPQPLATHLAMLIATITLPTGTAAAQAARPANLFGAAIVALRELSSGN